MTDIVQRLRELRYGGQFEAATEIERLRAEVRSLRATVHEAMDYAEADNMPGLVACLLDELNRDTPYLYGRGL